MPAKNPRFTITLEQDTYRIFDKFTELAGVTKSSFINDLLHMSRSQLEHLVVLMQHARGAREDAAHDMAHNLRRILVNAESEFRPEGSAPDLFRQQDSPLSNRGSQNVPTAPRSPKVVRLERKPRGPL